MFIVSKMLNYAIRLTLKNALSNWTKLPWPWDLQENNLIVYYTLYTVVMYFLREVVYGVFTIGMCAGVSFDLASPRL